MTRSSDSERHLKLDPEPTSGHADRIQVLRPLLPDAQRLLSYLRRIDACRTYTNWGPLTSEFEARLAAHFDVPSGCVTSAVSGTEALVGAILATRPRSAADRPLAIIPAFTSRAARDASKVPRSRSVFAGTKRRRRRPRKGGSERRAGIRLTERPNERSHEHAPR